jgi:glucokinase
MEQRVLSLDIGGTKIAAGFVDRAGQVARYRTIPTEANRSGEDVLSRVVSLCKSLLHEELVDRVDLESLESLVVVGVSSAGQIDSKHGTVIYATENLPGWTGMDIKTRLESALGLPTFVENDVNCMALGEMVYGAGRGHRHILCMAIGTGIGGALILDGKLYRGWRGSAGELGHLCIDINGQPCNCGAHGCLEIYVAGPAIEKDFLRRMEEKQPPAFEKSHEKISLVDIAKLAHGGNVDAQNAIKSAGNYLGCGLFGLINLLNPEVVIIGGGVAKLGPAFLDEARRIVSTNALIPMRNTPIVSAELEGAYAGLVGAAVFCWQELGCDLLD